MTYAHSVVIPSINMVKDQHDFGEQLMKISFSHKVHLDISDGHFVDTVSFPKDIDFSFLHLHHFDYVEIHCMVQKPKHWIDFLSQCADVFIIHAEIENAAEMIEHIKSHERMVGIAIRPETQIESVKLFLDQADLINVLTVEPGPSGSPFVSDTLHKVKLLREMYPDKAIECDGSMNEHTIARAHAAGADMFVAGSALQQAKFPQKKFELLNSLINK